MTEHALLTFEEWKDADTSAHTAERKLRDTWDSTRLEVPVDLSRMVEVLVNAYRLREVATDRLRSLILLTATTTHDIRAGGRQTR